MNLDEPNLSSPVTRQKSDFQLPSTSTACSSAPDPCFQKMKIRTCHRIVDKQILQCTVQCIADYKVSRNDLIGIIVATANVVCGQNWSTASDLEEFDNTSESVNDTPAPDVLKRICNNFT